MRSYKRLRHELYGFTTNYKIIKYNAQTTSRYVSERKWGVQLKCLIVGSSSSQSTEKNENETVMKPQTIPNANSSFKWKTLAFLATMCQESSNFNRHFTFVFINENWKSCNFSSGKLKMSEISAHNNNLSSSIPCMCSILLLFHYCGQFWCIICISFGSFGNAHCKWLAESPESMEWSYQNVQRRTADFVLLLIKLIVRRSQEPMSPFELIFYIDINGSMVHRFFFFRLTK